MGIMFWANFFFSLIWVPCYATSFNSGANEQLCGVLSFNSGANEQLCGVVSFNSGVNEQRCGVTMNVSVLVLVWICICGCLWIWTCVCRYVSIGFHDNVLLYTTPPERPWKCQCSYSFSFQVFVDNYIKKITHRLSFSNHLLQLSFISVFTI